MADNYYKKYALNSGAISKRMGAHPSYLHGQRHAKTTVKNILERAFQDTSKYQFYPHSVDYSKVFVTISFPYEKVDFPVVVVDSQPGTYVIGDFDNFVRDLHDDYGNAIGERYGSLIDSSLSITVYAKSTLERDEIADLVITQLWIVARDALESQGIVIFQPTIDGDAEEDFGTDKIYSLSIGIKNYTHWYYDVLYEYIENVITDNPIGIAPPNNQGPPEDPYLPPDIIHLPPEDGPKPNFGDSRYAAAASGGDCECGDPISQLNTGPNPGSRYYQAATDELNCCGEEDKNSDDDT